MLFTRKEKCFFKLPEPVILRAFQKKTTTANLRHVDTTTSMNSLPRNPPTRRLRQHGHRKRHILRLPQPMLQRRHHALHLNHLVESSAGAVARARHHIRLGQCGRDDVDRMPLRPQLARPPPTQRLQRRLRRAVHARTRVADAAEHGPDADDAARRAQVRENRLRREQRAAHVDVEDGGVLVGGDGAEGLGEFDAGVVDEDVDGRAESGGRGGDDLGGRVDGAGVGLDFDGCGAGVEGGDLGEDGVGEGGAAGGDEGDGDLG